MKFCILLSMAGLEATRGSQLLKSTAAGRDAASFHPSTNCSDWQKGVAGYDVVLNSTLSQVAVNDPMTFKEFDHGSSYEGLFVDPIRHFAFCTIEKNGCTEWSAILHKLWKSDPMEDRVAHGIPHMSATYWGPSRQHMVFANPSAVRAVFVREPLARFASAFLDKCTTMNCGNPFCFARTALGFKDGMALTMRDAVVWMLARDPATLDSHWKLQSEHCELKKRIREYNIVGYMRKDSLAQDSACIMDHAGIAEFNAQSNGMPFWMSTTAYGEKEVEGEPRPIDGDAKTDASEDGVLKKLFTTSAARMLIAHLKQDYQVFGFESEPAWVANATGEWYEAVPSGFCGSDKFMRKSPYLEVLGNTSDADNTSDSDADARGGEDDVVRLAHHAGFTSLKPASSTAE